MKHIIALFLSLLFATEAFADSFSQYSSGQILGTNINDNACAGCVGEFISSNIGVGAPVPLTTGVPINLTSISLTPGDWDVSGDCAFVPANTTSVTFLGCAPATTSATLGLASNGASLNYGSFVSTAGAATLPTGNWRVSIAATTTVFLVIQSNFTVSTTTGFGIIRARRVR